MLIDPEVLKKAQEELGVDYIADWCAELLDLEHYDKKRHVCQCPNPNHRDSTPSCSFDPKLYKFHCFGCGENFDIVDALIQGEHLTFIDACKKLCETAKVPLDYTEQGVRKMDYKYPKPSYAESKEHVYAYWSMRGISPATIDYLDIQEDVHGNTLFQYYNSEDVLTMIKVRKSCKVPKGETKTWCLAGADTSPILYNMNRVNADAPLIICSGEGDAATAIECGFYNVVSEPLGDQNMAWVSENFDWLSQFNEIILIHDNDTAGVKFAKDASIRLGEYRTKVADIPRIVDIDGKKYGINDLNELLYRCGKDAVAEVIMAAKRAEIDTLVDYSNITAANMSDVDGFVTGFQEIDLLLDKFYCGTTTILTGSPGSGKSSLISTLICRALDQGFPSFVYSGELSNCSLKNWIQSVHAGQEGVNEYVQQSGSRYYRIRPEISRAINEYYRDKLFFYKDSVEQNTERLFATMEAAVRLHGVKFVILDNMSSVTVDGEREDGSDHWMKQSEFVRDLINFAKKWNVVCLVVLHPKKMQFIQHMSLYDLSGVVSAANLAHRVLSLYRVPPKEKTGTNPVMWDVTLDILKDRYGNGTNKSIGLYYDIPSKRFFTTRENLAHQYDWDGREIETDKLLPYGCPQLDQYNEVYGEPITVTA